MLLTGNDAALNQEAQMLKRSGNFYGACAIYDELIGRISDNSDLYYNLAKVYSSMGRPEYALPNYMCSLHIDLIDFEKTITEPFFDLILDYTVSIDCYEKKILFHQGFANTVSNIGKMASGLYDPSDYQKAATADSLEYGKLIDLNSLEDSIHIRSGIQYAFEKLNWTSIQNGDKDRHLLDKYWEK